MHQCASLLAKVLDVSRLEEKALEEENTHEAEQLAEKRFQLLEQAWQEREGYDKDALRESLLQIEAAQKRLQTLAEALHGKMSATLHTNRKQSKYFANYRHVKAQAKRSQFCDEIS